MNGVAKEYGGALFALALEENADEPLLKETRAIRAIFEENPDYVRLLSCPDIPTEERLQSLDGALGGRVHPYVLNFLKILTERGRIRSVFECFDEYERQYYETRGVVRARAESAVALNDSQKRRLTERLEALTGKRIELHCAVNPELLAGIRLTVDNRLYEESARSKLKAIGDSLTSIAL